MTSESVYRFGIVSTVLLSECGAQKSDWKDVYTTGPYGETGMDRGDADGDGPCSCKVTTVATACGLDDIHDRLRNEWRHEDGKSVRELATLFNRRILESAFSDAGQRPLDGEIANFYRLLTDESVDAGSRTRARQQLRQDGVPVDTVEDRFVSHQTLYRHLVNCLDAEQTGHERTDSERVEAWEDRLLALQNRTKTVTDRAIERLQDNEVLDIGTHDVLVDVNVLCEDCGAFLTIEELLSERACDCRHIEREQ